jgi:hypothetical protein
VVAGVRASSKAETVFGQLGISEGIQQSGSGILFVLEGVDVTNPETLSAELFKGVTQVRRLLGPPAGRARRCGACCSAALPGVQPAPPRSCTLQRSLSLPLTRGPAADAQVVTCLGGVFGPLPEGGMGYIDGMSPERVEAQGGPLAGGWWSLAGGCRWC